jgi:hypothetical protein
MLWREVRAMTEAEWWLTEAEWLGQPTTWQMIEFLADIGSERKLRLFAHACCQRIEHLLVDPRSQAALSALADYADACGRGEPGLLCDEALAAKRAIEAPLVWDNCLHTTAESHAASAVVYASHTAYVGARRTPHYGTSTVGCAANAAVVAIGSVAYRRAEIRSETEAAEGIEAAIQAALLRDIFGNPFRPVAFDPDWRTSTVTALAKQMYGSRDFSAMPILADALQDAGCDSDDILDHCRGAGPHVRGCWVVDLVLGKE